MQKYTIKDFNKDFPDNDTCLNWLKDYLYPNGIYCPLCKKTTKHHLISSRQSFSCDRCGHHVHPTVSTIFEKSSTPLNIWFYTIFQMASTRCGIAAKQIQRETGVTYKTAWRMCNKIRSMLDEKGSSLSGKVEVDETYIGGKRKGKRGRGSAGKSVVMGAAQREGKVRAYKAENVKQTTTVPFVKEHILPKSIVYTDELPSYNKLPNHGYNHRRIHHASRVYVTGNGDIHTNTIEGFWSLLKRGINGAYHAISAKHL